MKKQLDVLYVSNKKVQKAISKPIPKKIIDCFYDTPLTASQIAEAVSFPKDKIYYHIKKLIALDILFVSETEEVKGIVQKKFLPRSIQNSKLKNAKIHMFPTLSWINFEAPIAEKSNDPLLFKAYLEQYPNGNFAPLARAKIEVLANSKVQDKKVQEQAEVRVEERDERLWVGAKLLSVRRGPGTKFDKIGRLSQGTEVEITGKVADSNWYRIKTENGSIGFVFGKYLDQEAPRSNSDVARTEPQPASVTASSSQSRRSAPSGQIEIVNASRLKISPSAYQLIKDTVRRSISGREWTAVERVTVRLTNLGARKERNPDYAGAKLAQGVFGALVGRNIQLGNVAATNTFLHAEVTVIAVLKDGTSWTDAATHTVKGDGQSNRRLSIQMQETVMKAVTQATNRVVIRMSGGVPPVASSGVGVNASTQSSKNATPTSAGGSWGDDDSR